MPANKKSNNGSTTNQISWVPNNDDAIRNEKSLLCKVHFQLHKIFVNMTCIISSRHSVVFKLINKQDYY
jgi:hypothetical protein